MTRKLIFLPLILLFVSCTITKRVHRPGYHIQWRNIERSQAPVKSDIKLKHGLLTESQALILEPRKVETVHFPTDVKPVLVSDIVQNLISEPVHNDHTPSRELQNTPTASTSPNLPSEFQTKELEAIPPIFWRTPSANLKKLGIALMIIGGMMLFASLLVYLGAFSGSGNVAWLNFFLDLVTISEWFWLLIFVVLFILVAYLFFLFVLHVLGSPVTGVIVGLSLLALGIFFYTLGKRRTPEPPNP